MVLFYSAYGIFEPLTYARICSNKSDFKTRSKRLWSKLEKQGFNKKILQNSFVKFYRSHYDKVRKYGALIKDLREPWIVWEDIDALYPFLLIVIFVGVFV